VKQLIEDGKRAAKAAAEKAEADAAAPKGKPE
jgi:hypothetical protein